MVQIGISKRHGHLSEESQAKVREKLERLPKYFDRLTAIDLIVDFEAHESLSVELKVAAKAHQFVARSRATELLTAVDDAVEKMEQQLRKHKDKLQDSHRGPAPRP